MFNKFDVEQQVTLAEFIMEYLPHISADPEIGKTVSTMHQWHSLSTMIYYEKCPVGVFQCINDNMCEEYREYNAQLLFKQVCFNISYAFMDYLQVCIISFLLLT